MGGSYSTHGRYETRIGPTTFVENQKRRDHMEELIVLGWEDVTEMGLKEITKNEGVCRFQLAQGRALWWAIVNTVLNLRFRKRWGIS
jgi:hypothetical protein